MKRAAVLVLVSLMLSGCGKPQQTAKITDAKPIQETPVKQEVVNGFTIEDKERRKVNPVREDRITATDQSGLELVLDDIMEATNED